MKRNPIDWSCGNVVDTSALDLTSKQKYDIEIDNEKIQNKILRARSNGRMRNAIQSRTNR